VNCSNSVLLTESCEGCSSCVLQNVDVGFFFLVFDCKTRSGLLQWYGRADSVLLLVVAV
jgi:hypothetical protein